MFAIIYLYIYTAYILLKYIWIKTEEKPPQVLMNLLYNKEHSFIEIAL